MSAVVAPRQFEIAHGPLARWLRRIHLARRGDDRPRAWALVLIAWVPLVVGGMLRVLAGERPPPMLFDISVHTRVLVGIPLMIAAERILEQRCQSACAQLYEGSFAERAALDRIFDRAERLRDTRWIAISLVVIVMLAGQAMLWQVLGSTGVFAGIAHTGALSFARVWYATVAWPLFVLLFVRWLWHWTIWSYVVVRVSRLPLATIATHPDHAAGIGFLASPISGFSGFVLVVASLLASVWGTQILDGRTTLQALAPSFISFAVVTAVIACGPLLFYVGILYRARHREIHRYNGVALDYVRAFHHRWVDAERGGDAMLGTPDLQSLNDLIGAFGSLEKVRLVPFGPRTLLGMWVATVIPMLPLIATTMPLTELATHIGRALLGGFG